jgi:hypothetical protein
MCCASPRWRHRPLARSVSACCCRAAVVQVSDPLVVAGRLAPDTDILNYQCKYWDEDEQGWSSNGVALVAFEVDASTGNLLALCATSHLTDFSGATKPEVCLVCPSLCVPVPFLSFASHGRRPLARAGFSSCVCVTGSGL